MSICGRVAILVALGLVMSCPQARGQVTIPKAHGTTLAGTTVVLPDALNGKVGVLVLGFSHGSQGLVAAWGKRLAADFGKSAGVAYYEMPMIGGAPRMIRGMILKSMGKSVPEAEQPHFLPLMEDDKPWRAVVHYSKADDAYVLLVTGDGTVLWQTEGDATDKAWGNLKPRLEKLLVRQNGEH
jgi:hypothetical protein